MAWGIIVFVIAGPLAAGTIIAPKLSLGSIVSTDFFAKRNAEQVITAMLIDPDPARFRNVVWVHAPAAGTLVCGEVNSRNRLGGFSGFTRFVVSRTTGKAVMASENPPTEKQMYSDQVDCDRAETDEDKSLYFERSKRSTAEYEADKQYRELSASCPVA